MHFQEITWKDKRPAEKILLFDRTFPVTTAGGYKKMVFPISQKLIMRTFE